MNGSCRHYDYQDGRMICRAGLDIGKAHGNALACLSMPTKRCSERSELTQAEIDEEEAASAASFSLVMLFLAAIPDRKVQEAGELDCPVCKVGRVTFYYAKSNGHLHAGCCTSGCIEVHQ